MNSDHPTGSNPQSDQAESDEILIYKIRGLPKACVYKAQPVNVVPGRALIPIEDTPPRSKIADYKNLNLVPMLELRSQERIINENIKGVFLFLITRFDILLPKDDQRTQIPKGITFVTQSQTTSSSSSSQANNSLPPSEHQCFIKFK